MVFAAPEPKPKADPQVLAYSSPLVGGYVSSAYNYPAYTGNYAYPYAASASYVASPYTAAYAAPYYYR